MSDFATFDFETMAPADCYRLTTSTVVPRPIAWVVTKAASGIVNVAPYSFFNAFGEDPVILVLGLLGSREPGRRDKDTAGNIRQTGEFVVNLVPERLRQPMNATTINAPPEVSEMDLAGLTPAPSLKVAPPRIAESPVAFECTLLHALETGPKQTTVIGRVVALHIAREFLDGDPARPRVLTERIGLIGRMHGRAWYARTTDLFEMDRPGGLDRLMADPRPSVAFIGIGAMGRPMAARAAAAGFDLLLHDADHARAEAAAHAIGARASRGPDLAEAAELIVTMLPTSAIVAAAIDPLLPALRPGTLVVEMSSGEPEATRALAQRVAEAGGQLIDAPVSGGVPRAETGELAIMVGGDPAAVARADPLLRSMGRTITHTGPVGSAHAMKALNNLVSAGGFLLGIEALLIGRRFGLDPSLMVDVLNASTGMTNSSQKKFKQFVLSRRFDAGFGLDLMVKDLGIALGVARATATPAPLAALTRELWAAAQAMLGPGQDHTAAAKLLETLAGTELGDPDAAPP